MSPACLYSTYNTLIVSLYVRSSPFAGSARKKNQTKIIKSSLKMAAFNAREQIWSEQATVITFSQLH